MLTPPFGWFEFVFSAGDLVVNAYGDVLVADPAVDLRCQFDDVCRDNSDGGGECMLFMMFSFYSYLMNSFP